jgi:hypothetical protein
MIIKGAFFNRCLQPVHHVKVVMNVMDRVQFGAKDLTTLVQMMQIGPGKIPTGVAITAWVNRTCIGLMGRIPDSHHPL